MAFLTGFVLTARSDPLLPEVHAAPIALCVLTCAVAPVTTSQQGKNVWALWRHVRTVVRTFAKIGQLQLKLSSINIFHCIKLLYFSLSVAFQKIWVMYRQMYGHSRKCVNFSSNHHQSISSTASVKLLYFSLSVAFQKIWVMYRHYRQFYGHSQK